MTTVEEITSYLSKTIQPGKKLALFLDYDGTLAPICADVDLAIMPTETKAILTNILKKPNVFPAIISGRQADNAKKMVGMEEFTYAGSHGFEIIYTDGSRYKHEVSAGDHRRLCDIEKALREIVKDGAWVENKGDVLTFHVREVPLNKRDPLLNRAKEITRCYGIEATDAICAIEIQPPVNWNKGYTGEFLLKTKFGSKWNEIVNVIFIGDDISDEKLMEMFQGKASTFRVSTDPNVKTAAGLRLKSQEDVVKVLTWINENY